MTVDIIRNGYVFTNVPALIKIDSSINQHGDVVKRTAQNLSIKVHIPTGISVVDFQADKIGVVYNYAQSIITVNSITSDRPIYCSFMIRVDDETTAVNSQWRIDLEDITNNPVQTFRYEPIIIGGLTRSDVINIIGLSVDNTVAYVSTDSSGNQIWNRIDANTNTVLGQFTVPASSTGLPDYSSVLSFVSKSAALASLGPNKMFKYAEVNLDFKHGLDIT